MKNGSIRLQEKDLAFTEELRNITLHIADILENEENRLTKFFADFTDMLNHIVAQPLFMDVNVRNQIKKECERLLIDASENMELLGKLLAWSDNKKKVELSKLSLKVEILQDIDKEKRLVKVLRYNADVVKLVDDIIGLIKTSEKEVSADIAESRKTSEQIRNFKQKLEAVRKSLEQILGSINTSVDVNEIRGDLQKILADIKEEMDEFANLDKLERVHLQLLIKLYDEEEQSMQKEKKFDEGDTESLDYIQEDV